MIIPPCNIITNFEFISDYVHILSIYPIEAVILLVSHGLVRFTIEHICYYNQEKFDQKDQLPAWTNILTDQEWHDGSFEYKFRTV